MAAIISKKRSRLVFDLAVWKVYCAPMYPTLATQARDMEGWSYKVLSYMQIYDSVWSCHPFSAQITSQACRLIQTYIKSRTYLVGAHENHNKS